MSKDYVRYLEGDCKDFNSYVREEGVIVRIGDNYWNTTGLVKKQFTTAFRCLFSFVQVIGFKFADNAARLLSFQLNQAIYLVKGVSFISEIKEINKFSSENLKR